MADREERGLLGDSPIIESGRIDALDFIHTAKVIAEATVESKNPLTVGVYGRWGTGKTSLMRLIRQQVSAQATPTVAVWFNAWRYEKEAHLIVPLLATINKEIQQQIEAGTSKWDAAVKEGAGKVKNALRAIAYVFSISGKVGIPLISEAEVNLSGKDMVERYQELTKDTMLSRSLYFDAFDELDTLAKLAADGKKEGAQDPNRPKPPRIVVFIDDLDRCFPPRAVELLENIKLVLHQPGFAFVLGVNDTIIREFVKTKYQKEFYLPEAQKQDEEYLDKIVQLAVYVPSPGGGEMSNYVKKLLEEAKIHAEFTKGIAAPHRLYTVIADAAERNPRSIVRLLNGLIVAWRIQMSKGVTEFSLLALLIQTMVEERIRRGGKLGAEVFRFLDQLDSTIDQEMGAPSLGRTLAEGLKHPSVVVDQSHESLLRALRAVVKQAPLVNDAINVLQESEPLTRVLMTDAGRDWLSDKEFRRKLGAVVEASKPIQETPAPAPALTKTTEWAIRQIEESMIPIRGGTFTMEQRDEKVEVTLSPFRLSKFLVKQEVYEALMGANPSILMAPQSPVSWVSWEDAAAFCERLFALTGKPWHLPTEAQWEYACRVGSTPDFSSGNEDALIRRHGWGGKESGWTAQPAGEKLPNAWGLDDLQGNTWEWCADWYGPLSGGTDPSGYPTSSGVRVVRSGGWHDAASRFRSGFVPGFRAANLGFRLAQVGGAE